jgi:hypothetical protein
MPDDLAPHHGDEGYVGIHGRTQSIYQLRFFRTAKCRFMHLKHEFKVVRSFGSDLNHAMLSKRPSFDSRHYHGPIIGAQSAATP